MRYRLHISTRITGALITAFALPILPMANGGVNLKNGNFYITYTDVVVPGFSKMAIVRTYNSRATIKGIFGFGWGSDFETRLTVGSDGTATIHENGSGSLRQFNAAGNASDRIGFSLDQIARSQRRLGALPAGGSVKILESRLADDRELRLAHTSAVRKRGILPPHQTALGTALRSATVGCGKFNCAACMGGAGEHQVLRRIPSGWVRSIPGGGKDYFDLNGKLTRKVDSNNRSITVHYGSKGEIDELRDYRGRWMRFSYTLGGRVERIVTDDGKIARYWYDEKENLTKTLDTGGNVYLHSYDRKRNMTRITYNDNSSLQIGYNKLQFVGKIITKNGNVTNYDYESDPEKPDFHYWTIVRKEIDGKPIENRYEYEIGKRKDGRRYTRRITTLEEGVSGEKLYDEENRMIFTSKGDERTDYSYADGFFAFESGDERRDFEIGRADGLVHKATILDKKESVTETVTATYDRTKNLINIDSSIGDTLSADYDLMGNLEKVTLGGDTLQLHRNLQRAVEAVSLGENGPHLKVEWGSDEEGWQIEEGVPDADAKAATELMKRMRERFEIFGKFKLL